MDNIIGLDWDGPIKTIHVKINVDMLKEALEPYIKSLFVGDVRSVTFTGHGGKPFQDLVGLVAEVNVCHIKKVNPPEIKDGY